MLKPHIILGISPGTRTIGIAILRYNRLAEWQIKGFKGAWSESKQKDICYVLKGIIERENITSIALKRPDPMHSSPAIDSLLIELQNIVRLKKLRFKEYTLLDLKRFCSSDRKFTKADMIRFVAEKFPVLNAEYNKEQKNRFPYYAKMFEAIIAAMLLHKEYLIKNSILSPFSEL